MKPGLVYGIIYLLVFILVSGGIYYIADTQPELLIVKIPGISKEEPEDTSTVVQKSLKIKLLEDQIPEHDFYAFLQDTTKKLPREKVIEVRYDTIYQDVKYQDPALLDSINVINQSLVDAARQISNKEKEIKQLKGRIIEEKDDKYTAWLKKTVKIYEAMKPADAAKLITEKSDSEARDLLYAMKQKKAAEVLANLSDSTATVLTRSK